MSMRLELLFPRPFAAEELVSLRIAIGALAKVRRVVPWRNAQGATVVAAETLGRAAVAEALAEAGLPAVTIRTSLDEEEDRVAEDTGAAARPERVRPIGR